MPSGDNPAKKGALGAEPRQFRIKRKGRQRKTGRQKDAIRQREIDKDETRKLRKNTKGDKKKEQGPHHRPKPEEVGILVRTPTCPPAAPYVRPLQVAAGLKPA